MALGGRIGSGSADLVDEATDADLAGGGNGGGGGLATAAWEVEEEDPPVVPETFWANFFGAISK